MVYIVTCQNNEFTIKKWLFCNNKNLMQSLFNASMKARFYAVLGYLQNDEKRVNSTTRND